jgi:hypothetical protein
MADIERDARPDFRFDDGFAAQEPEGEPQRIEGAAPEKYKQGVHQGVALDQSAVEVDAEGPARHLRRQLLNGRLVQGNLSHVPGHKN